MIAATSVPPTSATSPGARDESELVDAARAGDAGAFRALVEAHAPRARALARRLVRDARDAEEIAQDAFVRAWRALPAFRGEASFATWMHRIVVRVAWDAQRRGAQRRQHEIAELDGVLDRAAAPAAEEHETQWAVLLESLPPVGRAAVVLFYWHDRSVREVAEVLEMPEGTVKSHLSRARATLREAYARAERRASRDGE